MEAFNSFLGSVQTAILNPLITLLAMIAFLYFVWGVVEFIRNADDESKRKEGRQHIIWGLVGLAVIFGAQAILSILASTISVDVP
jgi:uncharacterized membrane protein YidH (DUF202 family)